MMALITVTKLYEVWGSKKGRNFGLYPLGWARTREDIVLLAETFASLKQWDEISIAWWDYYDGGIRTLGYLTDGRWRQGASMLSKLGIQPHATP